MTALSALLSDSASDRIPGLSGGGFRVADSLGDRRERCVDFAAVLYRGDELITKWDCAHAMVHRDIYAEESKRFAHGFEPCPPIAEPRKNKGFVQSLIRMILRK